MSKIMPRRTPSNSQDPLVWAGKQRGVHRLRETDVLTPPPSVPAGPQPRRRDRRAKKEAK